MSQYETSAISAGKYSDTFTAVYAVNFFAKLLTHILLLLWITYYEY